MDVDLSNPSGRIRVCWKVKCINLARLDCSDFISVPFFIHNKWKGNANDAFGFFFECHIKSSIIHFDELFSTHGSVEMTKFANFSW